MGRFYEKYLDDIEGEMKQRPFMEMADKQVQQLSPEFSRIRREISDNMRREGASSLSKARFSLDQEGQIIDTVGRIYNEAEMKEISRQDSMRGEHREAQLMADKEKEANKRAKKDATAQKWKTAAEIIGTVGGTIGTGGNIAAGMAIGRAAGGVSDVVTGLDKSYDSPESIVQGGANILSGVISTVDTIGQQNFTEGLKENMGAFANMSAFEREQFMVEYQLALNGNNADRNMFLEKLKRYGSVEA